MTSVPLRLAAFAVVLVLSLGGCFVLGNVVGPLDQGPSGTDHDVDAGPDRAPAPAEHDGSGAGHGGSGAGHGGSGGS